jgi:hypothetical protein
MPVHNDRDPYRAICPTAVPARRCLAVALTGLASNIPAKLPADPEEPFLGVTTSESTDAGVALFQGAGVAQVDTEDRFPPATRLVMAPGGMVRAVRPPAEDDPEGTVQSVGIAVDEGRGAEGKPDIVGMLIQPQRVRGS